MQADSPPESSPPSPRSRRSGACEPSTVADVLPVGGLLRRSSPAVYEVSMTIRPAHREGRLTFSHVSKRFGVVQALADCSFSVEHGRMLGFLGPNGAGRQPRCAPCSGSYRSTQESALERPPHRTGGAIALWVHAGERGLYPRMRVGEQLAYFGCLHGLTTARHVLRRRGGSSASILPTAPTPSSRGASHGNQQRAQLAAAPAPAGSARAR